jgi:5'-nucleotidase
VHGTPVMATMYGLDVLAPARWGKAPDLVLSGPNEGQNVGRVVINSGTIGNAQFAAGRGLPAIALSAGTDTVDNNGLAAAGSKTVAQLTVKLIAALQAKAGSSTLLPAGTALNVNFPNAVTASTPWSFSRIGTYDTYALKFSSAAPWGLSGSLPPAATADQAEDEAVVYKTKIAVSAMQVGYEHRPAGQQWLRLRLRDLFAQ